MATCRQCHSLLPDGTLFCGRCGYAFDTALPALWGKPASSLADLKDAAYKPENAAQPQLYNNIFAEKEDFIPTQPLQPEIDLSTSNQAMLQTESVPAVSIPENGSAGPAILEGAAELVSFPQQNMAAQLYGQQPVQAHEPGLIPHQPHLHQLANREPLQPHAHQQPQALHGSHQQPQVLHGSHQQPQALHGSHQQPHLHAAQHGRHAVQNGCRFSCLTGGISAVAVVTIAILLITYFVTHASNAVPTPGLTLLGSAIPGQAMTLRGNGFLPGNVLTIMLDNQPLTTIDAPASVLETSGGLHVHALNALPALTLLQAAGTITVKSDGTFTVPISVDQHWRKGSMHKLSVYGQDSKLIKDKEFPVIADLPAKNANPCINASTQALSFASQPGQSAPPAKSVSITNCGDSGNWLAVVSTDDGGNWLTVSSMGGALAAGAAQDVAVNVATAQLPAGNYAGHVTLSIGAQTVTVAVTLAVTTTAPNPPCINVNTGSLAFNMLAGGNDPAAQQVMISNGNGCGAGSWSASSDQSWLNINPAGEQIAVGSSRVVSIAVSGAQLSVGEHVAHVTFSPGTGSVTVNVTVQPALPCITVDTSALTFAATLRGNNPARQSVALMNGNNCGASGWTATASDSWLSFDAQSQQIAAGGQVSAGISVNVANLVPNTYTGTVTFNAGQSSAQVKVTFTVLPRPCMTTAPGQLSFSGGLGTYGRDPATQSIVVSNCSTRSGSVTATARMNTGEGWLSVSGDGQMDAQGNLTFTVKALSRSANINQGTYTGYIALVFTTSDGITTQINVQVTLTAYIVIG